MVVFFFSSRSRSTLRTAAWRKRKNKATLTRPLGHEIKTTNLSERLRVDPKEHPLLLAEPTVQSDADRERMVELAFEGHAPPAVFLSRAAVLASFATGRPTAVVVDIGHEGTTGDEANFCFCVL